MSEVGATTLEKTGGSAKGGRIYLFEEGSKDMKDLLGGKGAGLAEMTRAGFPVPPGFTITTEVCNIYNANGKVLPEGLEQEIREKLTTVEQKTGKGFGDSKNPLLVSVRSGARFSMPGMMETILNLGLNDETIKGVVSLTNDERFAYDCYRRLIQMFGEVVMGIEKETFSGLLEEAKKARGAAKDTELTADDWKHLVRKYKELFFEKTGSPFPQDPHIQLIKAVQAVFDSWDSPNAVTYREHEKIPHNLGTAVNVQAMVFGNLGEDSGTAVAFTRNPSTGEKKFFGDFLQNAQGEDVVAGIRTPLPIAEMGTLFPDIYNQIAGFAEKLEKHYKDMQDLEFTIEKGRLYMLQTRTGKRTADAAVTVAVQMVEEGLISKEEALKRVTPAQLDQLLHPRFDPTFHYEPLARGLPASPGAAVGEVVFDANDAARLGKDGKKLILVRPETTPDDVHGMLAARGVLTSRGGMTSHAAVVARGWGKPCIVGCEAVQIDLEDRKFRVGEVVVSEGEIISINASTGEVVRGEVPLIQPKGLSGDVEVLLKWADERKRLGVYTNADTPQDAKRARDFGATGIGLCRTEHMFMQPERLVIMQEMIMAHTVEARTEALHKLLPFQKEDFKGILGAMEGYPVTIRLLDPPLHEFLPQLDELLVAETKLELENRQPGSFSPKELFDLLETREVLELLKVDQLLSLAGGTYGAILQEMKKLQVQELIPQEMTPERKEAVSSLFRYKEFVSWLLETKEKVLERVRQLHEFNPMLGLRVCRLGIVFPEIYQMQVQAIFEAACELVSEGVRVFPEVMIPGVGHVNEMKFTRKLSQTVAERTMAQKGLTVAYKIGTMIELPRACVVADQLAHFAEFFSFGTNDLTQTVYGYSRDDAEKSFVPEYRRKEILDHNPFEILDTEGVGELMEMAIKKGRGVNPELKVGICGEHGGEPSSVHFCHKVGLNYVSCSPYRVPIARLAAAQVALADTGYTTA